MTSLWNKLCSFLVYCFNVVQTLLLQNAGTVLLSHKQTGTSVLTVEKNLKQITEELVSVATKWRCIGTQLNVGYSSLELIETDRQRTRDRFSNMIVEWIKNTEQPTWMLIVEALRSAVVKELTLAARLEWKFCSADSAFIIDTGSQQQSGETKSSICVIGLIALLVISSCIIVYVYRNDLIKSLRVMQSKTLPYISNVFVGRDEEVSNITQLLDFEQSSTRVVCISGPPGFGKSTLAIKVGHHFAEEGYTVFYVNMHAVLSMQVLAEKILKGADILRKQVTIERMNQWARDISSHTLLIVDNCDDIIHEHKDEFQRVVQDLMQSSYLIKVLMTSRRKATFLDDSYEFRLKEFTPEASSSLLSVIITKSSLVNEDERLKLATITGNVPLALRIVGSLLNTPDPPSAQKVIGELQSELIETLSREELPSHDRIQASLNLSYRYLSQSEKRCAQVIALFPGSFSFDAAEGIVSVLMSDHKGSVKECLRVLFQRSLLEFEQRSERYCYHTLLRNFFRYKLKHEECLNIEKKFQLSFQKYYAHALHKLSISFKLDFAGPLKLYDLEKHNIELFVNYTLLSLDDCNCLADIEAIALALDTGFLQCRFSLPQLITLSTTICIKFSKCLAVHNWDPKWFFIHYTKFAVHWAKYQFQLQEYTVANAELYIKSFIIEDLWSKANDPSLSVHYVSFYTALSDTYEMIGHNEGVLACQKKIMEKANAIEGCEPDECDYNYLGTFYFNAGNYERSAHFYELYIALPFQSNLQQKANCLLNLYNAYTKLWRRNAAEIVLKNIISLLPQVLDQSTLHYQKVLRRLLHLFRTVNEKKYATLVMDKLLAILINAKVSDQTIPDLAVDLMKLLCDDNDYSQAVELGGMALKYLDLLEENDKVIAYRSKLYILLAWAELNQGNLPLLLWHLDQSLALIKNNDRMEVCKYLVWTCWRFMWFKPRCIKETFFCKMKNIENTFGELETTKQSILANIPAPTVSKELTMHNSQVFPVLIFSFSASDAMLQWYTSILNHFPHEIIKFAAFIFVIIKYFIILPFCIIIPAVLLPYMALCGQLYCLCSLLLYKFGTRIYFTFVVIYFVIDLMLIWSAYHWIFVLLFIISGTCIFFVQGQALWKLWLYMSLMLYCISFWLLLYSSL